MKKSILFIFSAFLCTITYSQNTEAKNILKNFSFGIGMEYRITPAEFNSSKNIHANEHPFTDNHNALTGESINMSLQWNHEKTGLHLKFSNYFRYDHIGFEKDVNAIEGDYIKAVNAFLKDFQFELIKSVKINEQSKFQFAFGYALMNNGSEYAFIDETSNMKRSNLSFSGYSFKLGYQYEQLLFQMGGYFVEGGSFDRSGFYLPSIQLNYIIGK